MVRGCIMVALVVQAAACTTEIRAADRLRLAAICSDGMVLQRDQPAAIWGWAEPGGTVTVDFAGRWRTADVDDAGAWAVRLEPAAASSEPRDLVVTSSAGETRTVRDVLVGEVWLCAGQSNMAMTVNGTTAWLRIGGVLDAERVVAESTNPRIRQFNVDWKVSTTPLDDCTGAWTAAGPRTTPEFSATGYFFARALEQRLDVPVAIINASWGGSTVENWTSREALTAGTDAEFVGTMDRILRDYDRHDELVTAHVAELAAWEANHGRLDPAGPDDDARYAAVDADLGGWRPVKLPANLATLGHPHGGVVWLRREIDVPEEYGGRWRLDFPATKAVHHIFIDGMPIFAGTAANEGAGKASRPTLPREAARAGRRVLAIKLHAHTAQAGIVGGPFAVVPFDPRLPRIPLDGAWLCTVEKEFGALPPGAAPVPAAPVKAVLHWQPVPGQFNAMLLPLVPYAIRGVAWYQGESNVGKPDYARRLRLLVADWRGRWGRDDLPFLVCQLPGFGPPSTVPGESRWAECREAQFRVLDLPHTGIANLIDTCEDGDLHPRNKKDAGERLALVARAQVYGDEQAAWSGPVFDAVSFERGRAVVTFRHAAGLAARELPATYRPDVWKQPDVTKPLPVPTPGSPLQGFAICGADRVWHWATATIAGARVVVSSAAVADPVAVRYGWADHPVCNLVNSAGLPAFPFRTDDFPSVTP